MGWPRFVSVLTQPRPADKQPAVLRLLRDTWYDCRMNTLRITEQMELSVATDLYQAGVQCDGHPFIAESFYVQLTLPSGWRLRHEARFAGTTPTHDEEGYTHFTDERPQARAAAERLIASVRRRGSIHLTHWQTSRPVYGSTDYSPHDDIALERKEDA